VLRGLLGAQVAYLALRGEAHEFELGVDWEALVEGEPNEGAQFFGAGVMPYSGDGFWS